MKLFTNVPDFYNDISEEIRLFLPREEIVLSDSISDCDVSVQLTADEERFTADCTFICGGNTYHYTESDPFRTGSEIIEKRYSKRCVKTGVFRTIRQAFPDKFMPWGSLTGIRPTRLLRELTETEGGEEAYRLMTGQFDVSPAKVALASEINSVQQPVIDSALPDEFGVYIGVPFCRTRCLYCSFASELRTKKTDMSAYLSALQRDIEMGSRMAKAHGLVPRSFYMGGGTPTVLTESELDSLLACVSSCYDTAGKEFTVEAGRPDTITEGKLRVLKANGVTRISVNPQTMCDRTLRLVGRDHNAADIVECFNTARMIGFDSINMDLIAGLPNETADDFARSLEAVEALSPDCLTVHTLAIKRASRLKEHLDEYAFPSVEEVMHMVDMGSKAAARMGMKPYYMYRQKYMAGNLENVGYSKAGAVCIYNIDMMEDGVSIIAHGAGSMTKRVWAEGGRIERVPNPKDIATYIAKLDETQAVRERLFSL